jgi:hypothetical protein
MHLCMQNETETFVKCVMGILGLYKNEAHN